VNEVERGKILFEYGFSNGNGKKRVIATYDYLELNGKLIHQTVRYEPKGFAQRRPDGNGGWIWNLKGITPVLYRLQEVAKADTVLIVEGEKDVESIRRANWKITATTNPMGAEKWRENYNEYLRNKSIFIVPDNDEKGLNHAYNVAESVCRVAKEVRVVKFPRELNGKSVKDITNFIEAGGTENKFNEYVIGAEVYKPVSTEKQDWFQAWNTKYALVQIKSNVAVLNTESDELSLIGTRAFKTLTENETISVTDAHGNEKKIQKSRLWLTHPERRTFQGIEFNSKGVSHGFYNLWKGFKVTSNAKGDFTLFREHVETNICNENPELISFFWNWWACIFQHAHIKQGTMLVMQGGKGTGKTITGKIFGKLLQPYYKIANTDRYISERFNAHLTDCLLLQCEEAFYAGNPKISSIIKDLITNENIMIEMKGYEPIMVKNFTRFYVTSNHDRVVPAELDERRFFILEITNKKKGDCLFFDSMLKQLDNGGYQGLMHFLMTYPCNLRLPVPNTEALATQKRLNADMETEFIVELMQRSGLKNFEIPISMRDKYTIKDRNTWDDDDWYRIRTDDLKNAFLCYCEKMKSNCYNLQNCETKLGVKLRNLLSNTRKRRLGTEQDRFNVYELPPRKLALKEFEEKTGIFIEKD